MLARQSVQANNSLGARMAYFLSIQLWKKVVKEQPALSTHLMEARKEYLHFIRSDLKYREVLTEILTVVGRHPGITEKELFASLSKYHETDLKYTIYFAIKDGQIWCVKKESRCEYHLPSTGHTLSFKSLLKLLRTKISTN